MRTPGAETVPFDNHMISSGKLSDAQATLDNTTHPVVSRYLQCLLTTLRFHRVLVLKDQKVEWIDGSREHLDKDLTSPWIRNIVLQQM